MVAWTGMGSRAAPRRDTVTREETARPGEWRWLVGIWVLVAVFGLITAWRSEHVGIPLRDPEGQMFRGRLTSALVLFAVRHRPRRGAASTPPSAGARVAIAGVLARPLDARAVGAGAERVAGLPPRLRLLPQPQELGRLQRPSGTTTLLGRRQVAVRRGTARPSCSTTCSARAPRRSSSWRIYTLLHLPGAVLALVACAGLRRPDPRRLRLPQRPRSVDRGSSASPPTTCVPSLGPFAAAPGEFAGLRPRPSPTTQAEYLRERATPPAPTHRRATPSRASRPSPACTSASPAWCG